MKRILPIVATLVTVSAQACYNDRDTLGFELRQRPEVQRALAGRFERNPPLYYEMRIARLRAKPRLNAAEHDDLAVALDRLGRSDEALAALDPRVTVTNADRYRFFANRGTIRAHRWIKDRRSLADLEAAESDIARALKVNPKAHFGRERTQLELIRWLENSQSPKAEKIGLGEWLTEHVTDADPSEGLAGLVTLGAAWESPDVALALAEIATIRMRLDLAQVAKLRYRELIAAGRRPLVLDRAKIVEAWLADLKLQPTPATEVETQKRFQTLRKEADQWQHDRMEYMVEKLRAGRHPDTDPQFWKGWNEPEMPRLPTKRTNASTGTWILLTLFGVAAMAALSAFLLARAQTRRRRLEM